MHNRLGDNLKIRYVLLRRYLSIALQLLRQEGLSAFLRRVRDRLAPPLTELPAPQRRFALEPQIGALDFPAAAKPEVSVVIPCYGQHLHTYSCLKSLTRAAQEMPLEVILVDDCSPQPVALALAEVTGIRIERLAQNAGFVHACNRGAALARSPLLLLLNNDTLVLPGALTALRRLLERWPRAAMVAPKLLYPDGRLQEAGGILWRDGSAWNYGRGDDARRPEYNYVREVDFASGACLLLERERFEALGGFDPAYAPAYYEDADLTFRLRAAGDAVLYQPAAEVVHFEGVSCGSDRTAGLKRHQLLNQAHFARRWASVLASHAPNGMRVERERERYLGQRVLVIDAYTPTPDKDSGSVRMWAMLELLRELGCRVSFLPLNLACAQPYAGRLQQSGIEMLYAPFVTALHGWLTAHGRSFDWIILSRFTVAKRVLEELTALRPPRPRVVFDTVDLHYLREERYAQLTGGALDRRQASETRFLELNLIAKADVTLVVSRYEQALLQRELPRADIRVLSNIHRVHGSASPFGRRQGALFIGGFRHPPNTDAVQWLAHDIVPRVAAEIPDFQLHVIGSHMPESMRRLASEHLVIEGYVEDLEPFFSRCRLSVAPLRYGAGVKGKVNLSMSHGLPVVSTSIGVEGMDLRPGEDVLVADEAAELARQVVRLYRDQALWQRLSANGLANVERQFSRATARRCLGSLLGLETERTAPM
jgi:GT2 family glycosyltransferase